MSSRTARRPFQSGQKLLPCLALVISLLFTSTAWADLDVNAVAGTVTIDGSPAPSGMIIRITDQTNGQFATTEVDGPNIPPFERGQGRFDTGDVPQFSTGDRVQVRVQDPTVQGMASGTLSAGTTTINLDAHTDSPPSISTIPDQEGFEDQAWDLDLDPYISDPDTPKEELVVMCYDNHVTVEGHTLSFLYPGGVIQDTVVFYVRDASSTVTGHVKVSIKPVNDPPTISQIPPLTITQGCDASLNLSDYVEDPDNAVGDMVWQIDGADGVGAEIQGSILLLSTKDSDPGSYELTLTVTDPLGLSGNGTLEIHVEANLTALTEFYQDEIDALNAQIANLSEENLNLTDQVASLLEEVSQVREENLALQSSLEEAERNATRLGQLLSAAQALNAQEAESLKELEAQRQNLTARLKGVKDDLEEALTRYDSVTQEFNATKARYEAQIALLQGEISELEANLSSLEAMTVAQDDLVANLTAEKNSLETELGAKETRIAELEKLSGELETQIEILQGEKERAEESLAEVNSTLEELQRRNSDLQSQLKELTTLAPAYLVGPRNDSNLSSGGQGLIESLFAEAARLTVRTTRVVYHGLKSTTGFLILLMIVVASAISIAARTSWVRMASRGGRGGSAMAYWRQIEKRARHGGGGGGKTAGGISSTAGRTRVSRRTPSEGIFVNRRPTRPARRIYASSKPVSIRGSGLAREQRERLRVAESREEKARGAMTPTGRQVRGQKPSSPSPGQHEKPTSLVVKKEPEGVRTTPRETSKDEALAGLKGTPRLSEVDREYINTLIELGFTKEAEEELRKRSSS